MREPLFLRFINKELGVSDLLEAFSKTTEPSTLSAIDDARLEPPDIEPFRIEMIDAVRDLITTGIGDEFKAFVNHYMSDSLEEDVQHIDSQLGENVSRTARVLDSSSPWIQGFICYNLCLYIKAFGLENLKSCRVCDKFFNHKGKYAVYCSDPCKVKGKEDGPAKKEVPQ